MEQNVKNVATACRRLSFAFALIGLKKKKERKKRNQ